eukprot:4200858-Pyramimonas_sp.AAC.1
MEGGSFSRRGPRPGAAHTRLPNCSSFCEWTASCLQDGEGIGHGTLRKGTQGLEAGGKSTPWTGCEYHSCHCLIRDPPVSATSRAHSFTNAPTVLGSPLGFAHMLLQSLPSTLTWLLHDLCDPA